MGTPPEGQQREMRNRDQWRVNAGGKVAEACKVKPSPVSPARPRAGGRLIISPILEHPPAVCDTSSRCE